MHIYARTPLYLTPSQPARMEEARRPVQAPTVCEMRVPPGLPKQGEQTTEAGDRKGSLYNCLKTRASISADSRYITAGR